jgi:acyl-CoA thioester hydrolase
MANAPLIVSYDIDWVSLDLFGHVNNMAFFFYVQKARVTLCEGIGLTSLNEAGKLGFIVASSQCNFLKPLFYPGIVSVHGHIKTIGRSSFTLNYKLFNQTHELCATAEDVLVLYNYQQRLKVSIDESLNARMIQYLQK